MKSFFDALISYGRPDSKAFAIKLHARLLEVGLDVWFDQNDIPFGVDYQNQIDDGIEKAHNFIFIIAPHSVKSLYCRKEIELAVKRNKRIIPLLHINADEFMPQTNPIIGKINWILFQEGIDDFEASFSSLISLIHHQADYVKQHTWFLAKALEWERNQKQTSYLLIGEERVQAESWLKTRFKDEQPPCVPTDLHCEFICESTKNANNLMTQVFISYADSDKRFMQKISQTLMREGFTIWTNKSDIKTGTAFQEESHKGIEQADNFIYLISYHSISSKYCQDELAHALEYNKRIISVLIEAIEIEEIPVNLRSLQFINCLEQRDEELYTLNKLLKILYEEEHYYEQHKILLVKALKWVRQNRNPSILLRGYDLQHAEAWLKAAKQQREHLPLLLHEEFIAESIRQPTESSLEVFISYSRADSDFARKLNEALQIQGKTTWFDQESIASASDFQQEIYRGIESSNNFLFIISPKSVNSLYCADEVEFAQRLNKRFVTVLHREVSGKDLHPALGWVQWIDFNRHSGDFYANFGELVRTLDTDREHVHNHTKWSQRSLEWEQRGKTNDLLLRGSEFSIAQQWLLDAEQHNKQPTATPLQKEYIRKSREVLFSEIKQEKHQADILKLLLGLVSAGFVISIGVGIFAFSQWKRAELVQQGQINSLSRYSLALSDKDRKFDALIEAIRAGRQLQKRYGVNPAAQSLVLTALQTAVYGDGFRERDRLSGHDNDVNSVSFSHKGQLIATASRDKTVKLWSRQEKLLKTLPHDTNVNSVSFSPDDQTIATASYKAVTLWSREGKVLKTLPHNDNVNSVSFSPDGQTIASASYKAVTLWSRDGQLLQILPHDDWVNSVSFSPDGQTIASASYKAVTLWSRDGQLLQTLPHDDWINSVSFSPDGQTIASASYKAVQLWSRDGKRLQTLPHDNWVKSVSFSPDGQTIASASSDKTVKLWSRDGQLLQTLTHDNEIVCVSFSSDAQTIASASRDSTVQLWSRGGKVLKTLPHNTNVNSVSFSPDGQTIASASNDKTVKLWNRKGKFLQTLPHDNHVNSVSFSPDGKLIASASYKTVKLWSRDGHLLQTLPHDNWVTSVGFSLDSKFIISACGDKTVKLWSRDGHLLQTFPHGSWVNSVSFSPDGQLIVSAGGDSKVKLWSRDGHLLQTLPHDDTVYSVSFSPDGKIIASASDDNTIKLWSRDGKLRKTLSYDTQFKSISFSPDGKILAAASGDKTVKLWSLEGELLQTLKGHPDQVNSVSFSPDGNTIASASMDGTVILWNLDDLHLNKLIRDACDWVEDYLKNKPKEDSDRTLCDGISKK